MDAEGNGGWGEGEREMPSHFSLTILKHSVPREPGVMVPSHLQVEEAFWYVGHQTSLFPKAPL